MTLRMIGTMENSVEQAGTSRSLHKGQRVQLFPAKNQPFPASLGYFASPVDGTWGEDSILLSPGDVIVETGTPPIDSATHKDIRRRLARYNALVDGYRDKRSGWASLNAAQQETIRLSMLPDSVPTNEERGAVELFEFLTDPPDRLFCYIDESKARVILAGCSPYRRVEGVVATTFMGDLLGHVQLGQEFRSNFGDRRVPVKFRAINGASYSGTYYKDSGTYARVRKVKAKGRQS